MQKLRKSNVLSVLIFGLCMGGVTSVLATHTDPQTDPHNAWRRPYYSRLGRVISTGQRAHATFITDHPTVSAAVIAALEGALVGLYLYKIAPGEKFSGQDALTVSVKAALVFFITRFFLHRNRSANAGQTPLRPLMEDRAKALAAPLALEVAVRTASLAWKLAYEAWWLSRFADRIAHPEQDRQKALLDAFVWGPLFYDPLSVVAHELGHGLVNRMITGSSFKISLGRPAPDRKNALCSKTILGIPVTIYPFNPILGMGGQCECLAYPASTGGRIAMLTAGPLGGMVGDLTLCSVHSAVMGSPFMGTWDRFFVENIFGEINNLLDPYFNADRGVPCDAAHIFRALGINP